MLNQKTQRAILAFLDNFLPMVRYSVMRTAKRTSALEDSTKSMESYVSMNLRHSILLETGQVWVHNVI